MGEIRSALAGALVVEPTSLKSGEGLLPGWLYVFERELRPRWRVVVMREDEGINHDLVDVLFKLRSYDTRLRLIYTLVSSIEKIKTVPF